MSGNMFRIANAVMMAVFLVSVALQYNDPDPIRWMAIYGSAAIACLLAGRGRRPWLLPAVVGLVALIWAGAMAPYVIPELRFADLMKTMKAATPAIEESREMLGLLIVASWMAVLTFRRRKGSPGGSR